MISDELRREIQREIRSQLVVGQSQLPPSFKMKELEVRKGVTLSDRAAKDIQQSFITTSSLAGGPPASPHDQDIWIATAVDANGTRWAFQYNLQSTNASKWEFFGGPPIEVSVATDESTTTVGSWLDLTTVGPTYTTTRSGDYILGFTVDMYHTATPASSGIGINGGNGAAYSPLIGGAATTGWGQVRMTGVAASTALKLQYYNGTAGTFHARGRRLYVTPIRIA